MSKAIPVGIFAASSVVPQIEFARGLEHLKKSGFAPTIHAQVAKHEFIFPGSDEERAAAFDDSARDPKINILWAARGGYGAGRLLPILDRMTRERGAPSKKLLIGYSDVTVLHEFVRTRWGWSTLHAPMPAASNFAQLDAAEWNAIVQFARSEAADPPWTQTPLKWMNDPPKETIRAQLIGGNLSLWAALVGTKFLSAGAGKIIFLEDIGEPFYRIDRMMVQLEQSGALDGAAAIVLGDFTDCKDEDNTCLANECGTERKPLRKTFNQDEAFEQIFTPIARRMKIPLAQGLGVGHGPHFAPLPLGGWYELSPSGQFRLRQWDWQNSAGI